MFDAPIQDILAKRLQQVPELMVAPSFARDIDELVARHHSSGQIAVIDDANTASAYGDLVFKALKDRFDTTHITLASPVKADDAALAEIQAKSMRAELFIAVGSGTISDLVKLASFKSGKPYLIFATAVSMNGYMSKSASVSILGHKQSIMAHLPLALFADMQVIANSPARLSTAGLGDSLARPFAQADWLLSHTLLDTPYDNTPYELMVPYEPAVFEQAAAIARRDNAALEALLKLLLLGGFGMTIAGSSISASGAEHMIAHAYGMSRAPSRQNLHGEEIAFTSLWTSVWQDRLIDSSSPPDLLLAHVSEGAATLFGTAMTGCTPLFEKKMALVAKAFPDGVIDKDRWDKARDAMTSVSLPPEEIAYYIQEAALPDNVAALGWDGKDYGNVCRAARFTRDRFTCLDVLAA